MKEIRFDERQDKHTHAQSLERNTVGKMAGQSGMQLNTVIRFEGQFY